MDNPNYFDEVKVRVLIDKIINQRIEANKRHPDRQVGPLEAYLFKGDKVIVCPDVPNTYEFRGFVAIWQMVNMVQPDAFLVCGEAYSSKPNESELDSRLFYGNPHPSKQEILHFAVRSKNGTLRFDRVYRMIRNRSGTLVALQLDEQLDSSVCPWWGESDPTGAA